MSGKKKQDLEELKVVVKRFPKEPGVYIMRDVKKEIIYVGKAKNLKARVSSYFNGGDERYQIKFLMKRVVSIEVTVTGSESQAFILERDLINRHKPRYNIRLKDDKAYLSLKIDTNKEWPKLELVRKIENDGAQYYGPYSFSYEVKSLLDIINKAVPLRTCSDTVFYNRQRPCLEFQIKRCAAPCCLEVKKEDYSSWVKQAADILAGKTKKLLKELESSMEIASEDLRFEEAAAIRDRIDVLQKFRSGQQYTSSGTEDRDAFSFYREERLASVSVINVRNGRINDSKSYTFSSVEVSSEQLLQSVLEQYYSNDREVPEEILLPRELEDVEFLSSVLKEKSGKKVNIVIPKRGIKLRLCGLAEVNAKQFFVTTFGAEIRNQEAVESIAKICNLDQVPRKIECVDISNLQGSDIVGAVVSFTDGIPNKKDYKRYKMKNQGKPDDFASIYEVVERRIIRGVKENNLPDLIVIDGGAGQLKAACAARDEIGIKLDLIGLAKERKTKTKEERIFLEEKQKAIILKDGAAKDLMVRIRDEAHRFVIGFHRESRARRVQSSLLDGIAGIGPERRRRLLKYYGSVDKLKYFSADDIARVGRMPLGLAHKVLKVLKPDLD